MANEYEGSGYDLEVKQVHKESETMRKDATLDHRKRYAAWENITHCPECGSDSLFRFYHGGVNKYAIQCNSDPKVAKEPSKKVTGKPSSTPTKDVEMTFCGWSVYL
jgi:hypothetical protein